MSWTPPEAIETTVVQESQHDPNHDTPWHARSIRASREKCKGRPGTAADAGRRPPLPWFVAHAEKIIGAHVERHRQTVNPISPRGRCRPVFEVREGTDTGFNRTGQRGLRHPHRLAAGLHFGPQLEDRTRNRLRTERHSHPLSDESIPCQHEKGKINLYKTIDMQIYWCYASVQVSNEAGTPTQEALTMTAQERLAAIQNHLAANGKIMVVTYTKGTIYTKKHLGMFSATETDLFVQRGTRKECLTLSPIKFSR
jgi:hypothetical protein